MHQRVPPGLAALAHLALLLFLIGGCSHRPATVTAEAEGFRLRVLHINDHHSRLAPTPNQSLLLDGRIVQVELGGFPRVVAAFEHLAADAEHVLRLHAGDAITGDLYYTLFQGQADADLMNQICFDAFVVGNHEFDFGDLGLKRFLDYLSKRTWACDTPALGANVVPAAGQSPLAWFSPHDYLLPSIVLERGSKRIGIVGINIAGKTMNASSPDPGTLLTDEAAAAAREVAKLRESGVDIVILLTHVGYGNDISLAQQVPGIDAIVGGDSHSLLANRLAEFGLGVQGPYPTTLAGPDGRLVCVVQAWQYSWAVGKLDMVFDDQGRLQACQGRVQVLLGDQIHVDGQPLTGSELQSTQARLSAHPELLLIAPDPEADRILDFYRRQVDVFATEVIGEVAEHLCLRRVPGSHDRSRDAAPGCADATDVHAGHVQAVVAEAFLAQGQRFGGADIAIQNGGGVRNGIGPGPFTIGMAYTALPFKNTLVRLHMSGSEIHQVLEDAVEFFLQDPSAHSGAWPHAAGLRWHADLTRSRDQGRLQGIEVRLEGQWQPLLPEQQLRVITNEYIAAGSDGYGSFAGIIGEAREDTFLDYAQALVDHVRELGVLRRPDPEQASTRSFRDIDGRLFAR